MPTHHQKLNPLDQPITKRQALAMVQKVILAFEARLQQAGIAPLTMEDTDGVRIEG